MCILVILRVRRFVVRADNCVVRCVGKDSMESRLVVAIVERARWRREKVALAKRLQVVIWFGCQSFYMAKVGNFGLVTLGTYLGR